ncbi:unnamed protein product [Chironomus riparius]|uniref:Chitin-binding type-2 domain-containing protein n=1 Tax=Chironomus riparius TaxID=315576 RepID=A0A9N9WQ04_9DIPT|nr:unnamed protein product [Chironomus riparius]
MSSSLFYKCHNGFLLLLTCPRGMKFDPFLSACLPDERKDYSVHNIGTNLIKNPTPPYITTTSVKFSESNPIIPSTIPNPPILTSTHSSSHPDNDSITSMNIHPTPSLLTTILSTLVPDKAPIVTKMSIDDELPILTSTIRIPTPPLLTTSTSLAETSTLVPTTTGLSTTNADITNIPTAPTIFETTMKLFLPTSPAFKQLNHIEEEELGVDLS